MGWGSYHIYGGDGTQTRHYDFLKWAKVSRDDEEIQEWLGLRKTKVPKDRIFKLTENIDLILKKMPKEKKHLDNYDQEDNAIEWQMLAALFLDNKIKVPEKVYEMAKKSTEYLMGEHASCFDCPGTRRAILRRFIKRLEVNKND